MNIFFKNIFLILLFLLISGCASKRNITEMENGDFIWNNGAFQIIFDKEWTVTKQGMSDISMMNNNAVFARIIYSNNIITYESAIDSLRKSNDSRVTGCEKKVINGIDVLFITGEFKINNIFMQSYGLLYSGKEGSIFITTAYPENHLISASRAYKFFDGFSVVNN